ncbi:MAG: DUF3276 family protein [Rikenella sp.]|nr:DUF3276 family protein [Rikenella sp.]
MSNFDYNDRSEMDSMGDELYSVPVKAGKRIYYFDVKATRGGDYYVTITESRKKQMRDGSFTIDKHKIHLYKEDFQKFGEGFKEAVDYVKRERPELFNPDGSAIGSNNSSGDGMGSSVSEDDFFKGL